MSDKKKLLRNLDTPESREFWRLADEAAKEIAKWPEWKRVAAWKCAMCEMGMEHRCG